MDRKIPTGKKKLKDKPPETDCAESLEHLELEETWAWAPNVDPMLEAESE